MVRAKFKVSNIQFEIGSRILRGSDGFPLKDDKGREKYEACKKATIVAHPVYANGDPLHENSRFWEATPSGELRMGVVNAAAFEQFGIGQEFYLDFTPAGPVPELK